MLAAGLPIDLCGIHFSLSLFPQTACGDIKQQGMDLSRFLLNKGMPKHKAADTAFPDACNSYNVTVQVIANNSNNLLKLITQNICNITDQLLHWLHRISSGNPGNSSESFA